MAIINLLFFRVKFLLWILAEINLGLKEIVEPVA
jgi:hypothetical protein